MKPIIHTQRLTLRRPVEGDASAIARLFNDPDVARQTGTIAHPFTLVHAEFWIMIRPSRWRQELEFGYLITHAGEVIGTLALFRSQIGDDLDLGYVMGRSHRGRGLMSEAVRAVLANAAQSGHHRITASVFFDNPASLSVLRKSGFERIGQTQQFSMGRMERAAAYSFARHTVRQDQVA